MAVGVDPRMRRLLLLFSSCWLMCLVGSFVPSHEKVTSILSSSKDEGFISSTLPRLYIQESTTLAQDATMDLTKDQSHYITKVMRMGTKKTKEKKKNLVRLFDGCHGEWLAELSVVQGDARRRAPSMVSATCIQQLRQQPQHQLQPILFFAPLKKQRTKLLLEKCTELGVGRFVMVNTDRSDSGNAAACVRTRDTLYTQLVEASEQCERLTVPTLSTTSGDSTDMCSLESLLLDWSNNETTTTTTLLVCRERCDTAIPILQALQQNLNHTQVAFLVGPEGGWSPKEEDFFQEYSFVQSVSLGSLVLRAETAAMTAVAAYLLYQDYCNNAATES